MRPTLRQLYQDPKAIIAALDEAGMENAQARVMGMFLTLCEYWSMHRYHGRLEKDRTYALQSEARRLKNPGAKPDPEQAMRNRKQAGEYNKTLIVARGYLRRMERKMERKMSQWPEIELDMKKFRKKPDQELISKTLKKRMVKGKPRTKVLG